MMIIGSIVETTYNSNGIDTAGMNGTSSLMFYTMQEAITWARVQSGLMTYGTNGTPIYCLCSVVNTNDETMRWWFNGIEYTS